MSETANSRVALLGFAQVVSRLGPPFRSDGERRFLLRCELDAAVFHHHVAATPDGEWRSASLAEGAVRAETTEEMAELMRHFPTPRDAVAYIMDTFPIVRRKDEQKWGEYRTKRVILKIYDAMSDFMRTGQPYQTRPRPAPSRPALLPSAARWRGQRAWRAARPTAYALRAPGTPSIAGRPAGREARELQARMRRQLERRSPR